MVKFPSETNLLYQGPTISNAAFTDLGVVNVMKDLSIVNRRGYEMTTRKGVPLVTRLQVDVIPTGLDGTGYAYQTGGIDVISTVKFLTVPNNWVFRNAGVKWHAAFKKMFSKAGVRPQDLGAYAKTIRYQWDEANTSFLSPYDGEGAAFVGGDWDDTTLYSDLEDGFTLKLIGTGSDERGGLSISVLNMATSYLSSRATVPADSNLESTDIPSEKSILRDILKTAGTGGDIADDVTILAQGLGDNPPYDEFGGGDTGNDITEPVEAARIIIKADQPQVTSVVFDAPFGMFNMLGCHRDPGDNSGVTDDFAFKVRVLDIYEMQG